VKKIACLLIASCWVGSALASPYYFHSASGTNAWINVEAWAGSGTNESVLVVDWQFMGGPYQSESHAFGFRWNGEAYEADMLNALSNAKVFSLSSGYGGAFLEDIVYNDGVETLTHADELGSWNLASASSPYAQWGAMSSDWTKLGDWDANMAGYDQELLHSGFLEGINAILWFGSYPDGKTIDDYPLHVPFASAPIDPFADVQFWTGSGTNSAALVIDWKDGKSPQSLLWGYRWNGAATGADMLQAVVKADPRLFAHFAQSSWGLVTLGLGYDLNNSGGFGTSPSLVFDTNGIVLDANTSNANDARTAADVKDHYLEGWNAGYWAYYVKDSASQSRDSAMTGAGDRALTNGAWDGYSFAAGFDASEPSESAPALGNPYALEVVFSQGPFGGSPYDDPASVLGMPSTNFYDSWGAWSGGTTTRRVKLVEPAYNLDATQTHKLITTINEGGSIVVRFEQPIQSNPAHPYGVDFMVFGNSFYTGSGFSSDAVDMNTYSLTGGGFYEPMKVSVSPGYTGKAGQDPANSQTWEWYRYDNGPYADTPFPTQAYHWNRTNSTWSDQLMDFTKPVNPVLGSIFDIGGISAADGIDLYDGSGGGTGYSLAQSGFSSVQYIKIEGLADYGGGEVDAISATRPAVLGDSLSIAPNNLTNGTVTLLFQQPSHLGQSAVALTFKSVDKVARVATTPLSQNAVLPSAYGRVLTASQFALTAILETNAVTFAADVRLWTGSDYSGNGSDLVLLHQVGSDWENITATFDLTTRSVTVSGVTDLSLALALVQLQASSLRISSAVDGFGNPQMAVRFEALPGFQYTLLKSSTVDFSVSEEVGSVSPLLAQEATVYSGLDSKTAFFRVKVTPAVVDP
jgi:hypothetical protein